MATVTGLTAARMTTMENATVISGAVVGNNLMLTTKGGTQINAGAVKGPTGATGPPGSGYIICTSTTRPSLIAGDEGKAIYETDTDLIRTWTGTRWKLQERVICTSTTRPANLVTADEGVVIYETDTNLEYTWTGSAWIQTVVSAINRLMPVGFEMIWPGQLATIPAGFLHEDGSVLTRATYPELFLVLGTTWNIAGETALQFRLPDMRNRVAVGAGSSYPLGAYGGAASHVLSVGEMPSHTHPQNPHSHGPSDLVRQSGAGNGGLGLTNPGTLGTTSPATATNQNAGGNGAHNNMQPYAAKYVIIRAI